MLYKKKRETLAIIIVGFSYLYNGYCRTSESDNEVHDSFCVCDGKAETVYNRLKSN